MWRTLPGQAYRLRPFDDPEGVEYVIYNDLTGATHLLGEAAVHLLQVLRCGPATTGPLCQALAGALGCQRDSPFDAEALAILEQLAAYFLIERAA